MFRLEYLKDLSTRPLSAFLLAFALFTGVVLYAHPAHAKGVAEGQWVEYEVTNEGTRADNSGKPLKVRVMCLEKKDDAFWFEIQKTTSEGTKTTKFLAKPSESASLIDLVHPWEEATEIIIQNSGEVPQKVPQTSLNQYQPVLVDAFEGSNKRAVKTVKGPDTKDQGADSLKLGKKTVKGTKKTETREDLSEINLGFINLREETTYNVTALHSEEVPLTQMASFEATMTVASSNQQPGKEAQTRDPRVMKSKLVLKDFGKSGAESMIKGEPVEMKVAPLPFLKPQSGK